MGRITRSEGLDNPIFSYKTSRPAASTPKHEIPSPPTPQSPSRGGGEA